MIRVITMAVVVVMVVVMTVIMPMVVPVVVPVIVRMVVIRIKAAGTCAKTITKLAIFDIASGCRNALPLDMMVVAFLCQTNLSLKA